MIWNLWRSDIWHGSQQDKIKELAELCSRKGTASLPLPVSGGHHIPCLLTPPPFSNPATGGWVPLSHCQLPSAITLDCFFCLPLPLLRKLVTTLGPLRYQISSLSADEQPQFCFLCNLTSSQTPQKRTWDTILSTTPIQFSCNCLPCDIYPELCRTKNTSVRHFAVLFHFPHNLPFPLPLVPHKVLHVLSAP